MKKKKQKQKIILSIGIIFKNEIRCLERCLQSLQPLRNAIPCEVVMADTGSNDGSREVAKKYADILFDFPWIDDFSAARNAVIDRSSGRWFLSLDADEWLDPHIEKLAEFLQVSQEKFFLAGIVIRNFKTANSTDDDNFQDFFAMRIMRNNIGIRYEGCIHEHWKYPKTIPNTQIVRLEALAYHDGYAFESKGDMRAKYERNIALLKKKLEKEPNDLQTLAECIDAAKTMDESSEDYARRALEVLNAEWEKWGAFGARIYRDAVSVAQLRKLPELLEWADRAVELYPDSVYTRVDVAYCAYARSWDEQDIEGCIRWAEMYRQGLADYRAGNFDRDEMFRGILEFCTPFWERRLLIMLVECQLILGRYKDAFSVFECIRGAELDEEQQVEACTNMLLRLHRESSLDTSELVTRFWKEINQPTSSEVLAEQRRRRFINVAAATLVPDYRAQEMEREKFIRHGYTALVPLEGKCILGDGAAVLETTHIARLEEQLSAQNLKDFPISAILHALECGVRFPLPGRPMTMEEMDALAGRLIPLGRVQALALAAPLGEGVQSVCWKRALLLAALRACKWTNEKQDLLLAKEFVALERRFLPLCYAESALTAEGISLLPPLHRCGWCVVRAFDALESGSYSEYVRFLRKGLEACGSMKAMVEFLIDHTPELQAEQASSVSAELRALAEQVRVILAGRAPDDPAVLLLKSSEAYQKVSYLIEKAAAPVRGGVS